MAERGTIMSREPFDLARMFERMNETIDLVTATIKDVKSGVDSALAAVSTTAGDAQLLIKDIGVDIRAITASGQKVSADLQLMVAGVRQGRGSLGKFVNDDAVYEKVKSIAAEAERAVANLREASQNAKDAIADFRGDKGPIKGVVGDLQQSLTAARETLTDLADNSEALKRNFFFRGSSTGGAISTSTTSASNRTARARSRRRPAGAPGLGRRSGALRSGRERSGAAYRQRTPAARLSDRTVSSLSAEHSICYRGLFRHVDQRFAIFAEP